MAGAARGIGTWKVLWSDFKVLASVYSNSENVLADQRTLPHAKKYFLEASEILWAKLGEPIALDFAEHIHGFCVRGVSALRKADNSCAALIRLCVATPAAIGPQYFREAAEVIRAAAGGPPDRAKMVEIMRRHGLVPAPPPPQA